MIRETFLLLVVLSISGCGPHGSSAPAVVHREEPEAALPLAQAAQDSVVPGRTQPTIVSATHDVQNKKIVFTVHYLCDNLGAKGIIKREGYVLIDGTRYPVRLTDTMACGSHIEGQNVIEEYWIDNYKVAGEASEIPGLRHMGSVTFGIDNAVDGTPIRLEATVELNPYPQTTNPANAG